MAKMLIIFSFLSLLHFHVSFSAFLAPITHDPSVRRFLLSLQTKSPLQPMDLLIDLDVPLSWIDCTKSSGSEYKPVACGSSLCNSLTSRVACSRDCARPAGSACTNNSCHFFLSNPKHRKGVLVRAVVDQLALQSTDGRNPGQLGVIPKFVLTCSRRAPFRALVPKGMTGFAALGRSNYSLPVQVSAASGSPNVFALCLSSSPSAPGVAFFGSTGPYIFWPSEVDLSQHLNYTPLLVNYNNHTNALSTEYYIGLTSIRVNDRTAVMINRPAKLSLADPFTTLESSIYRSLTEAFLNESAALDLTAVKQPVSPFTVCFDAEAVSHSTAGPEVPAIDFVMQERDGGGGNGEKVWRMYGANAMIRREEEGVEVWCLAFVDGGESPRWPLVIGGHQMVDNMLQFDLESQRLGFSSSVMMHKTMCANFNFTLMST